MDYETWKKSVLGQGLNLDSVYGNQCVDVFLSYHRNVIGGGITRGNAVDYWENYPKDFYDRITRTEGTPKVPPQKGDVLIWGAMPHDEYGHIAIFDNLVTPDIYYSIDQNWPVEGYYDKNGNFIGTGKAHLQQHNWTYIKGWLRPKQPTSLEVHTVVITDQTIIPRIPLDKDAINVKDMQVDQIRSVVRDGYKNVAIAEGKVNELNETLKKVNDTYAGWDERMYNVEKERDTLKSDLKAIADELQVDANKDAILAHLEATQAVVEKQDNTIAEQNKTITDYQTKVVNLEAKVKSKTINLAQLISVWEFIKAKFLKNRGGK